MERDFTPRLISGIGRWELFPGIWIIGNAELDRYIRVPYESVEPVWRVIQYCDGHRSLSGISGMILADGGNLDVAVVFRKLADAGLVSGSKYVSDFNRAAVTWFEARIAGWFPAWRGWALLSHVLTAAIFLSVMAAGAIWLTTPAVAVGTWNPSNWEFAAAALSGFLVSILVHEAAHAFAACGEGLTPSRVRLSGYLGVIPYVVLSIPGIYTIRPAGRLRIWLAGPLASLSLASCSYLTSGLQALPVPARVWMDHMSLANVGLAVLNCCPLLPTDGYFVASTLLRQANWRIRSWHELSGCIRQRRKPQTLLLLYAAGSIAALGLLTVQCMNHILTMMHHSFFGYAAVLLLVLMFGLKRMALKRRGNAASMEGM